MKKELKKEIIKFLLDNENEFQIINAATKHFREYIYKGNGEYLIGGEDVSSFIVDADKLLNR